AQDGQPGRAGHRSGHHNGREPPEPDARRRRYRATIRGSTHARFACREGYLTMNPSSRPHPAEALILARHTPAVIERARQVRLMAFDVDGILTDGRLWYGEHGELLKCFHALDGHGLRLLRES